MTPYPLLPPPWNLPPLSSSKKKLISLCLHSSRAVLFFSTLEMFAVTFLLLYPSFVSATHLDEVAISRPTDPLLKAPDVKVKVRKFSKDDPKKIPRKILRQRKGRAKGAGSRQKKKNRLQRQRKQDQEITRRKIRWIWNLKCQLPIEGVGVRA